MDVAPLSLQRAVTRLWSIKGLHDATVANSEAFQDLLKTCLTLYGREGNQNAPANSQDVEFHKWALQNAIRNLGAPWHANQIPAPIQTAASTIHAGYTRREFDVTYLCPLDGADALPRSSFGPSRICEVSEDGLAEIVRPGRLLNFSSDYIFDCRRFSEFQWLVVREQVYAEPVAKRVAPFWFHVHLDDLNAVTAHKSRFPQVVERCLFILSVYPWERVVEHADFSWHPFRIPWVYRVTSDPFLAPAMPPSPSSLSWQNEMLGDDTIIERPARNDLRDRVTLDLEGVLQTWWTRCFPEASASTGSMSALNPVAQHFMLEAFLADGFDELVFHILAIEAALAQKKDRKWHGSTGKGATAALQARVLKLLGDPYSGEEFKRYYNIRSDFLHGRSLTAGCTRQDLRCLRELTRRIFVRFLLATSVVQKPDRERLLDLLGS